MTNEKLSEWCRETGVDYQFAWRRINLERMSKDTVLLCWDNWQFQRWCRNNDLPLAQAFSLRDSGLTNDEILSFFKRPLSQPLCGEHRRFTFREWCAKVGLPHRYARNAQTNFGFSTRTELLNWFKKSPDWVFHDGKWTYAYRGEPIEHWLTPDECDVVWDHAHCYSLQSCPNGRVQRVIDAYKLKPKHILERKTKR